MKKIKKLSEKEIKKITRKSLKETSKLLKNKDSQVPKVSNMNNLKECLAIFRKCFNEVRKKT